MAVVGTWRDGARGRMLTPVVAEAIPDCVLGVQLACILREEHFLVAQLDMPKQSRWQYQVHPYHPASAEKTGLLN